MRYLIEFEYSEGYEDSEWHKGGCLVEGDDRPEAVEKCKQLYELGTKYVYRITKVQTLLEQEQPYVENNVQEETIDGDLSDGTDSDGDPDE